MSRVLVDYLGERVGALASASGGIFFEYDPDFIAAGHELSPLALPLSRGVLSRDTPPSARLPGVFEDSLPDQWGTTLMTEWFRARGTPGHEVTPLMRLAYVGSRAIGALAYSPEEAVAAPGGPLSVDELYRAASRAEEGGEIDLEALATVATSAGGARPKALVAFGHGDRSRALPGAGPLPEGHEAWILKFDTTMRNDVAPMEEAYARMARAAGIDMPETCLVETSADGRTRRHFAVRRFDREGAARVHFHSLAGLLHAGPSDCDYATLLRATRRVTKDEREVWRAFRRAAFNVLAENRDDHAKNHGFLYRDRRWTLAPAFDLTFGAHIMDRGMALMGERRSAGPGHLLRLAEAEALDRRTAQGVIDEVRAATAGWREFAASAGVPPPRMAEIDLALRARHLAPAGR